MNAFIQLLKVIEMNPDIAQDDGYFDQTTPQMQEILSMADTLLITDKGQCNWKNIEILEREGFRVFAGECDGFGWLTGCISMMNGIIVYG